MDKARAVGLWRMPGAQDEPCSQVSGKGEWRTVERLVARSVGLTLSAEAEWMGPGLSFLSSRSQLLSGADIIRGRMRKW